MKAERVVDKLGFRASSPDISGFEVLNDFQGFESWVRASAARLEKSRGV